METLQTPEKDAGDLRDTKIIVDLRRISENMRLIHEMAGPSVAVMAVVKANAYGLGALRLAPVIMKSGASYLAVATLTEALELRRAYPSYPLFILGHTPSRCLSLVAKNRITQTVFSLAQVKALGQEAAKLGLTAKVHVKVDTGFHRLGQAPTEAYADEVAAMFRVPHIEVEGIFSHLALAGEGEDRKQFASLLTFIDMCEKRGCSFRYKHIADSIACVDYPDMRLNMIRPGALIYGMIGFHIGKLPVRCAVSFQSAISELHHIKKGEGVGYDYCWRASRDSLIATMPFGYADGYPRQFRDKGTVIIDGKKVPIVGVICMDQCVADVTDVPGVQEGDKVLIYGDGEDGSMTFQEASLLLGTNKNDLLCRLTARPPRIYRDEN